jgi:hypothetical protein
MRSRGIYIALGLFAAVAIIFVLAERTPSKSGTSSNPSPQPSPLVGLAAADVQQVTIKAKGQALTVRRESAAWTYSLCPADQAACPAQPADPLRAVALVAAVAGLRSSHTVYAPPALADYGLDTPKTAEIHVKSATKEVILLIGLKATLDPSYYVRKQDGTDVYAVPAVTVESELLGLIDSPPRVIPSPSPSPGAPATSPQASPSP